MGPWKRGPLLTPMVDEFEHLLKIAVLQTEVVNLKESIKLQAIEYERRLTDLNHAHQRSVEDKAQFVSSEMFFSKLGEYEKWKSDIDKWRSRMTGIAVGAGAVSGATAGLLSRILFK